MSTERVPDTHRARRSRFEGLHEVVIQEARGLEEFAQVLVRQREAVGTGDHPGLEASLEDMDRLLLRLSSLREQRQSMVDLLSGDPGQSLRTFLASHGSELPAALHVASQALRSAAETAAQATRTNSIVLRRVLASERAFLHSLFSEAPSPGYLEASPVPRAGLLLDRQG